MCSENTGYTQKDINGRCEECGEPTVDGDAYDQCAFCSTECKECGHAPCTERC